MWYTQTWKQGLSPLTFSSPMLVFFGGWWCKSDSEVPVRLLHEILPSRTENSPPKYEGMHIHTISSLKLELVSTFPVRRVFWVKNSGVLHSFNTNNQKLPFEVEFHVSFTRFSYEISSGNVYDMTKGYTVKDRGDRKKLHRSKAYFDECSI